MRSLAEAGGCSQLVLDYNSLKDPIENIIHRFKHHPSITKINDKKFNNTFEFNIVDSEEVAFEIKKLDPKKTTTWISISLLKDNVDICAPILTEIFNDCIKTGLSQMSSILPIFHQCSSQLIAQRTKIIDQSVY